MVGLLPPGAGATAPGQNGEIAFTSTRDGNREIYVVNPDGTGSANLTESPSNDDTAAWTSDFAPFNQRIYFASFRDGNGSLEIYAMDADGANPTRITNNTWTDWLPAPSSTDARLMWTSYELGDPEIWSSGPIPNLTNHPGQDYDPAWSPDGTKAAFTSIRDNNVDIHVMDAAGGPATRLTTHPSADGAPSWSPDGTKIAFESLRDGNYEIYVMNADGTDQTRITNEVQGDRQPSWSPDGTRIAFFTRRDGNSEIYTMDPDGANLERVTNHPGEDFTPDWRSLGANPGYARPKGATPMLIPLVLAFQPCAAPDRSHGPPLAFGSCGSPVPTTSRLTVGTADANGAAASFIGSVRLDVQAGAPGLPEDSDVTVTASVTDARCHADASGSYCGGANVAAGSDYIGELQAVLELRLTDRFNGPSVDVTTHTGTVGDISLPFGVPCAESAAGDRGGLCTATTSPDALIPGSVRDGQRAIWQLGAVRVFDGGPDAVASTHDNDLFATQGIFIP